MKYEEPKEAKFPTPTRGHVPQINIMMTYDRDFPLLKSFHDQARSTSHQPKVLNPTTREPDGSKRRFLF